MLRGYLDLLEFGQCDKDERNEYFRKAKLWLGRTETSFDSMSRQRQHLHRSRFHLLQGDIDAAENELTEANAASQRNVQQRGIPIMEAAIFLHKKEWDKAAKTLKKELDQLSPFGSKIRPQDSLISDPLMEAQCYVFLAQIKATQEDYAAARFYLDKWQGLSQFVDNYYLHHFAGKVITSRMPFSLDFDFPVFGGESDEVDKNILQRLQHFRDWLMDSVDTRYPNLNREKRAEILGQSPATLNRKFGGKPGKKTRG